MDPSVPVTLQHLLALTERNLAGGQEADDKEQQQNSGDEAIEMANNNNTLCASSSNGIESTNANLPNPEADKMKMEPAVEENGQSSNNGESFPMVQPITIQVKLSPLKATIPPYVQTSPYAEKIYKDANFSSFAEFEQAFEEWKQIFHHPFRVASSEKHEDIQLAQRFKYRYVVYHCSRYGEPRKRGANKRPHQNYLPCGCNAKLRLNFHTQNGGSLCVTTLYAEHNHEPISEDMKRVKISPENELGEHSPNSTASSIAAANAGPPFSPLSLQPGLHHSPSSGGQSSSEGANNDVLGLGGILNGLISPQSHQKLPLFHHHQQNGQHYLGKSTSMTTSAHSGAVHHQSMMTTPHARTNSQSTPNIGDFLESARQHGMNDQQQQLLLPLMALFRNGNAAIRSNQSPSSFGLLSTHAQAQQQKRQQQSTSSSSSFQNQPQNVMAGNAAVASSMLSAALNHQLQQIASTSSSSSSATPQTPNSSAMTLLQLQALINFFKQSKQHQQQTPSPAAAANPNAQQLLQQFFSNVGQQQAQQQRNFQLGATGGGFGHHSRESTTGGRQEIVQEADLLLQMLVDQMLRCHDLGAYLRRLRQFLTENYE